MQNIIQRLGNLITIKSLVTLILTVVFSVLLLTSKEIPDVFMTVYTMIIGFFFGTQKKDDTVKG